VSAASPATIHQVQITIDGNTTLVRSFAGGQPRGGVSIVTGPGNLPVRDLPTVSFEEMSWEMDMSLGSPMVDWIAGFLDNKHPRKDGTVTLAGANTEALAYLDFRDALMTEFGIPALDASSKDAAFLTIRVRPENVARRAGDKAELTGAAIVKQKAFVPSNFRVSIDGLPTDRVTKVDALSFRMKVQEVQRLQRQVELVATVVEMPTLKLTASAADMQPWNDWFKEFVVEGNSGPGKELAGAIEYLAPNRRDVLAKIELSDIGIVELAMDGRGAGRGSAATFTASMYFERATFAGGS
jgi:hypothetical protein